MVTRKLYYVMAALNGTANDAAHIDVTKDGIIRACSILCVNNTAMANGAYIRTEISMASSNMLATSDALNIIGQLDYGCNFTTSGAIQQGQIVIPGLAIEVKIGQRIYMHLITGQAATGFVTALIHIQ